MPMQPGDDRIVERIHACAEWIAESSLHMGGGEEDGASGVDMLLVRDRSGKYYAAGASIAGAARNALARRFLSGEDYAGGIENEHRELKLMFGFTSKQDGYASMLTVRDAPAEPSGVFVRDGVSIDPATGIAKDGEKYNSENLGAGTKLKLHFTLEVYHDVSGGDRAKLLGWFRAMLEAFESGEIGLGARTRRGLGHGAVPKGSWKIHRLSMNNRHHVAAWLNQEHEKGELAAIDSLGALPVQKPGTGPKWFEIDATLRLKTSLLIRSAGFSPGDPDQVHITEGANSLLTGSSFAGALRSRVSRIVKTLGSKPEIVANMFGPEKGAENLKASRVWVSECKLENGQRMVQGRVAIDRFTGGAMNGKLFDEAAYWPQGNGSHVRVKIRLENPDPNEVKLLAGAFKDLWLGDLPLGGETGVGRGVFAGVTASLRHWEVPGELTMTAKDGDPSRIGLTNTDGWRQFEKIIRDNGGHNDED